jgi:hypothetical protein
MLGEHEQLDLDDPPARAALHLLKEGITEVVRTWDGITT